jgi:hypothetical protein
MCASQLGDAEEAKNQFKAALAADPNTKLPEGKATPDIKKQFADAKGGDAPPKEKDNGGGGEAPAEEPSGLAATVWETYVRIVGVEYAGETMSTFQTGSNDDSDTLAYVIRADGDVQRWDLAANLAYSDNPPELIATLVHEYAHILSLNSTEVEPFAKSCETLDLDEGCAEQDSYIFAFEREFWAEYGTDAPDATNGDDEVTDAFYAEHEEDFVSAYAATNVVEDFAESFMLYVIEPEPDNGETPTARKLLFFAQYPELVDIRDRIRAEFEGEL